MNYRHVKKRYYMYSCYIKKHRIHSYDNKRYVKVLFMKMRIMDNISYAYMITIVIHVYEICTENVINQLSAYDQVDG